MEKTKEQTRAEYLSLHADRATGRKQTALECRSVAVTSLGAVKALESIVNQLAAAQPATLVMDPKGMLETFRLVAAAAMSHAQTSANMAEKAAQAWDMLADEGTHNAAAILSLSERVADQMEADADRTMRSALDKPTGPVLAVDNGGLPN